MMASGQSQALREAMKGAKVGGITRGEHETEGSNRHHSTRELERSPGAAQRASRGTPIRSYHAPAIPAQNNVTTGITLAPGPEVHKVMTLGPSNTAKVITAGPNDVTKATTPGPKDFAIQPTTPGLADAARAAAL
jgi:hypothetical protein